jgi:hypothetical protein
VTIIGLEDKTWYTARLHPWLTLQDGIDIGFRIGCIFGDSRAAYTIMAIITVRREFGSGNLSFQRVIRSRSAVK